MADELPTMKNLFPEWYAFQAVELNVNELKDKRCSLIKKKVYLHPNNLLFLLTSFPTAQQAGD